MLTGTRLRELLAYNPVTGIFYWRVKRGPRIKQPGQVAGCKDFRGYIIIVIDGGNYLGHRLAWFYCHGEWPNGGLDHKNGIKDANWIVNLREATQSQNSMNRGVQSNNTSGVPGVYWCQALHCWQAQITANRKRIHLGFHKELTAATDARRRAEIDLHGEFRRAA